MKKDNMTILLISIWILGFATVIASLYYQYGLTAILGITTPYYITKYLLVDKREESQE